MDPSFMQPPSLRLDVTETPGSMDDYRRPTCRLDDRYRTSQRIDDLLTCCHQLVLHGDQAAPELEHDPIGRVGGVRHQVGTGAIPLLRFGRRFRRIHLPWSSGQPHERSHDGGIRAASAG